MRSHIGLLALALTVSAAPLSAQVTTRQDPRERRPSTTGGAIGDIIFGQGRVEAPRDCRVRDAVTPDGRVVQVCDDRRGRRGDEDDDDRAFENRRDGRGRRSHVNDRDGDGDFDAADRAIRKRQHESLKERRKARRADD